MATVSEKELRKTVRAIIDEADLKQLSSKKVRKQLEAKYDTDLTERKKEIDGMVMECVARRQEEEEAKKKAKKTSTAAAAATNGNSEEEEEPSETEDKDEDASGSESDFEAPEDAGPVHKKQKVSKKSSKTDSSEDELDDAELAKKLQEEENGGRRTRTRNKPKKPPKAKSEKSGARKGTSTYSKPCALSPELARIMGTERMARKDVVSRMWEIVKQRKLQDPSNKQFMICDEDLQKVFGVKRLRTFGMMKYLKNHIKDVKDMYE